MAKAGFWLRGARGKLAGTSLGRGANGATIMREIVTPKNPRTNPQMLQRAVSATVSQAYSHGKEIFDHAFQGFAKGADNMNRFRSLNSRILRGLVKSDLDNNTKLSRCVSPRAMYAVPFEGMVISEGTYNQNLMTVTAGTADAFAKITLPAVADAAESAQEYIARVGLIPDDFYTIILFSIDGNSPVFRTQGYETPFSETFQSSFGFIRLRVKSSDELAAIEGDATQIKWKDLFTIENTNLTRVSWFDTATQATEVAFDTLVPDDYGAGALGVIRSRLDQDLRSNSTLVFAGIGNAFGLTAEYVIPAWTQGAEAVGNSKYILEGGNF